jgi:hypothetical protein
MKEKKVKAPAVEFVEVEIVNQRHGSLPVGMQIPMLLADAKKLIDAGKAEAVKE